MPATATEQPSEIRIAIVGGGCAGLAAAWELSKLSHCKVHVYEKSWRLGGKGASGRDEQGHIREHGLHVWLGFYENAFGMMRECYAAVENANWGPKSMVPGGKLAHGSLGEAFFPEPNIGVAITDGRAMIESKDHAAWMGYLPPAPGMPGEPLDPKSNPFTLASYLGRCLLLLKTLMLSVIGGPAASTPGVDDPDHRAPLDEAVDLDFSYDALRSPRYLVEWMTSLMRGTVLTTAAGLLQAVTIVETILHRFDFSPQVSDSLLQLLEAIAAQTRKQLRDLVEIDPNLRWKTEIIDIVMTIAVGLYRDRVLFDERGLDAINHIDYRDWLRQNGATYSSVNSPFMRGIYDLTFAYRDGDLEQPQLAAGVALRGALRMFFTYRGSMFWRMRSGMGDAVFAPLYKVLLQKPNVVFHFRHELTGIQLEERHGKHYIDNVKFTAMGNPEKLLVSGRNALDAFGCWPIDEHRFADFEGNTPRQIECNATADYHVFIFATGVDDFVAYTHGSVLHQLPGWDKLGELKTVATCAGQVWLQANLNQLGWFRGSGLVTALRGNLPFSTWADMTHTLASERAWRVAHSVVMPPGSSDQSGSIAYFCGVLKEQPEARAASSGGATDSVQAMLVHRAMIGTWLQEIIRNKLMVKLWPDSAGKLLNYHPQVNTAPSDRYALSLPGSIEYRVSPLDMTIPNMVVAGDWTASGLDAGCVESAVMSGMLAAHAVTGLPRLESIIGYDHP